MSVRRSYATTAHFSSEFTIREGTYRNVRLSEHCRPSKQALFGKELSPVKVSFVACKDKDSDGVCEWIVFNAGKELYVYPFEGVGKVPDLKHYVDKRVYKSPTIPVCHDFNQMTRGSSHLDLIVGFSTGPLQLLYPIERQAHSSYNEDGSIDNTRVTCVKWVPGSDHTFVSSHRSGCLYVWDSEQTSRTSGQQNYILHAETQDAKIHTVKPRNKSPILYRWTIGHGAINEFAFSPDSVHIAIASQDGFLRVYDFQKQVIYSRMRSYYGGFLCVCWSPDGKYTATGGEDDLITVWSFEHRKVVTRGEGHRSYVSAVAFDPYTTVLPDSDESDDAAGLTGSPTLQSQSASSLGRSLTELGGAEREVTAYRLGSVGLDTRLCLWDLSGDALKLRRPFIRTRSRGASRHAPHQPSSGTPSTKPADVSTNTASDQKSIPEDQKSELVSNHVGSSDDKVPEPDPVELDSKERESTPSVSSVSSDNKVSKKEKRKKSKDKGEDSGNSDSSKGFKLSKNSLTVKKVLQFVGVSSPSHSVGSRRCQVFETCNSDDIAPKMDEVNLIEPLVAKNISQERVTCLAFREDCIVTATQEGFINTWARPDTELPPEVLGVASVPTNPGINSPKPGSGPDHAHPGKTTAI